MSLRLRVLVGLAFVAMVLALMGVRTVRTTEHGLIAQVDSLLTRSAPRLRTTEGPSGGPGPSPFWVAVVTNGKLRIISEAELTRGDPGHPDLGAQEAVEHSGGPPFTVGVEGSEARYRVHVRAFGPQDRTVVLAAPLEDVDDTVRRVRNNEMVRGLVILAALGLVAFWVDRLGARPIRQMTAAATAISAGQTTMRVPTATPGTEAAELGDALNHMLNRLDEEFASRTASDARLRQFVADASHELRTPLTTITGYAELYRMGGLDQPGQLDEAMRRTEQEARRMADLVEDLLTLARLDQGRPLEMAPMDLTQILGDTAADARAVEPTRPVDVDVPPSLVINADEARIRQVLANLVANVRTHTDPDTPLRLRARLEPDWAIIEVADEGPGMDHETAARAFERFYRADTARARATGGAGLGLSIVASVVEAHHGHVRIIPTPAGGTTVQVALPLTPTTPPSP